MGARPKCPHQVRLAAAGLAEQHQDRPGRRRRGAAGAVQEVLEDRAGLGVNGLHIVWVGLPDGGRRGDRVEHFRAVGREKRGHDAGRRRPELRRQRQRCSWMVPFQEDEVKRRVQIHSLGVGHQLRVHRLNEVGAAQVQ